jgi:hypothetical protein
LPADTVICEPVVLFLGGLREDVICAQDACSKYLLRA